MVLVVVPAPGTDVEAAVSRIAALGIGAYEARQLLLKGVPFALAADMERARGTVLEMKALGLDAVAVDDEDWQRPVPLFVVRSFRLFPEGIEITTRPTAQVPASTHPIRWADVELIVPARSVQSTVVHSATTQRKIGMNPIKAMRAKTSTDHRHEESEERFTIVSARVPDSLLRFDMIGLDFMGLGDKRGPVGRQNYDTLIAQLKAGATNARVDDRLEKLASRLSGAATTTSSVNQSGPLLKKTERAFTDDNEGAVVAAARLLCLVARLRRS